MKRTIDIVGAGISGLATAYYLSKHENIHIRVWEKDKYPGGLAGSFDFKAKFTVEKFYHHIFKGDTALINLIGEMGLTNQLMWRPANTGSFYFNQPYRLSSPIDLLKFKPLPLISRIRMGLMVIMARRIKDWRQLDDITAKNYIIKTAGKKVYERVWEPLLKGKFGDYAESVSAAWIWSKFVDRGSSRSKGGFETLGYLRGGLGVLFEKLVTDLKNKGHEVNMQSPVLKFETDNNNITKIISNKGELNTDIVVHAAQLPDLVDFLPDIPYRHTIKQIGFLSNVCLVLTLNHTLSEFYWTNVTDPEAPFVGIIEQTNWVDKAEYNGNNLVYISSYVTANDKRLAMDTQELINHYMPYIKKMFPHFNSNYITDSVKWTAPYTQPIVRTGYRNLVPGTKTPINNLYVCTMAQIYPNDRQVSNGIERAKSTAQTILQSI